MTFKYRVNAFVGFTMCRGLWIEVTNPDSKYYRDALKTALNAAYHTFEVSHSFANYHDVFMKELNDVSGGSKGSQDDKPHSIDVALLVRIVASLSEGLTAFAHGKRTRRTFEYL